MGAKYEGCELTGVERSLNITTMADYLCFSQTQNFIILVGCCLFLKKTNETSNPS